MSIYEEVEIEDLDFDPSSQIYTYPCPCGDKFSIRLEDMWEIGEDIATCPSCTLRIRIIYDEEDLPELRQDDDADDCGDGEDEEQQIEDSQEADMNGLVGKLDQVELVRVH